MTNLEIRIKLVREDKSRIFKNWNEFTGISKEEFIDGLTWLDEDPMIETSYGLRMTRELGCDRNGLHRLKRTYNGGSFVAFYDENGSFWCYKPSINKQDRI